MFNSTNYRVASSLLLRRIAEDVEQHTTELSKSEAEQNDADTWLPAPIMEHLVFILSVLKYLEFPAIEQWDVGYGIISKYLIASEGHFLSTLNKLLNANKQTWEYVKGPDGQFKVNKTKPQKADGSPNYIKFPVQRPISDKIKQERWNRAIKFMGHEVGKTKDPATGETTYQRDFDDTDLARAFSPVQDAAEKPVFKNWEPAPYQHKPVSLDMPMGTPLKTKRPPAAPVAEPKTLEEARALDSKNETEYAQAKELYDTSREQYYKAYGHNQPPIKPKRHSRPPMWQATNPATGEQYEPKVVNDTTKLGPSQYRFGFLSILAAGDDDQAYAAEWLWWMNEAGFDFTTLSIVKELASMSGHYGAEVLSRMNDNQYVDLISSGVLESDTPDRIDWVKSTRGDKGRFRAPNLPNGKPQPKDRRTTLPQGAQPSQVVQRQAPVEEPLAEQDVEIDQDLEAVDEEGNVVENDKQKQTREQKEFASPKYIDKGFHPGMPLRIPSLASAGVQSSTKSQPLQVYAPGTNEMLPAYVGMGVVLPQLSDPAILKAPGFENKLYPDRFGYIVGIEPGPEYIFGTDAVKDLANKPEFANSKRRDTSGNPLPVQSTKHNVDKIYYLIYMPKWKKTIRTRAQRSPYDQIERVEVDKDWHHIDNEDVNGSAYNLLKWWVEGRRVDIDKALTTRGFGTNRPTNTKFDPTKTEEDAVGGNSSAHESDRYKRKAFLIHAIRTFLAQSSTPAGTVPPVGSTPPVTGAGAANVPKAPGGAAAQPGAEVTLPGAQAPMSVQNVNPDGSLIVKDPTNPTSTQSIPAGAVGATVSNPVPGVVVNKPAGT
jgi:hypothetical protein